MRSEESRRHLRDLARELLFLIGEDPDRPELAETPRRWAQMWEEFADYDAGKTTTTFHSNQTDQLVVVSGLRVWSMCEHHLLPFWCDLAIGYVTGDKVLGLSKFGRIAQRHAHHLQTQEGLVEDIAEEIAQTTGVPDVAVLARGEHLCMTMRGVGMGHLMTSSAMRGTFRDNPASRAEFLSLALPGGVR